MNVFVDKDANVAIKEILSKKNIDYSIKISIESDGWGGPTLGLTLYEEKENDDILNIDGIKIFLDEDVKNFPSDINIWNFNGEIIARYLGTSCSI